MPNGNTYFERTLDSWADLALKECDKSEVEAMLTALMHRIDGHKSEVEEHE